MKALLTYCAAVILLAAGTTPTPAADKNKDTAVYEIRTYYAAPGKLDALNVRFRDHTLKLFEKHGMTNVGYWVPLSDQKGAGDTLIYLLAHKSAEAAKASFDAFRKDPAWLAARKASEEQAG